MIKMLEEMPLKKFKWLTILTCALGDWVASIYVFLLVYHGKEAFIEGVKAAAMISSGTTIDPNQVMPELNKLYTTALNVTTGMLVFVICFHMLCYWIFYLNKGFGRFYVKLLVWLGAIFYTIFALTSLGSALCVLLFFQVALYIFIIMGLKKITPHEEKV